MELVVQKLIQRTADIRSFVLVHPEGAPLPPFEAGAHLDVAVRLPDGRAAKRSYSLVNHPEARGHYEIAVLRQADGRGGSKWMHDAVVEGMQLDIDAPSNAFPLAQDAASHTLIAGGIGITPLLCMARVLGQRGAVVDLYYLGRSPAGLAFRDELRAIEGLTLHEFCTDDPALAAEHLKPVIGAPAPGRHLYVCGPGGMIQSVIDIADAAAWPAACVHYELFGGQAVGRASQPFTVTLRASGRRIEVAANLSLLDALLAHGIDAAHDCRAGVCGTCLVPVAEGEIDHRDSFLSEDDRRDGGLMCACVSRARAEALTLDL